MDSLDKMVYDTLSNLQYSSSTWEFPVNDIHLHTCDVQWYLLPQVMQWIDRCFRPSKTFKMTSSYTYKHWCEDMLKTYVHNDTIKLAMFLSGYKAKNFKDINWRFKAEFQNNKEFFDYLASQNYVGIDDKEYKKYRDKGK